MSGTKHDKGKLRLDLIPVAILNQIAEVFTHGAEKYGDKNWQKGFNWERIAGAVQRHFNAWRMGENLDPESGISHLAHASAGLIFLQYFQLKQIGEDDRDITPIEKEVTITGNVTVNQTIDQIDWTKDLLPDSDDDNMKVRTEKQTHNDLVILDLIRLGKKFTEAEVEIIGHWPTVSIKAHATMLANKVGK